ncbi:putative flippase GtrA [Microlunatus panaciterrae]|uniref:Flippase GtrA n=1 Tax=Microlunatus panaciterrae TaxID=400768 RepID=A0ABS2RL63_9ACTN|nr:GtrA family protein [Microlunatus panaciterrae]MBM7799745.1 putative flippase GtrA [Microlunatus panaciterrae]
MSLATLLDRVRHLGPEAVKFGIVGLTGVAVQIVAFNLLRYAGPGGVGVLEPKPITAQVLAIGLATVITYLGNRHWTYQHREKGRVGRELPIFVILNGIAIGIGALCLAFSHYVLGLTSPLADNLSGNVVGLGLGTLFRFWSYRRFVFTGDSSRPESASPAPPEDPASAEPASR